VTAKVAAPGLGQKGAVTITQQDVADKMRVMGGVTLQFQPQAPTEPSVSAGLVTPYLVGVWDLRDARTLLHIVNPTASPLRLWVVFFDDLEKPLTCVKQELSANELLEIDVAKQRLGAKLGVVKVVALNRENDAPRVGIVGNQRITFSSQGVSETGLHPIPHDILHKDLKLIWPICTK
jgi:hypothetical protein